MSNEIDKIEYNEGLSFRIDEEGKVYAVFTACQNKRPEMALLLFKERLVESGMSQYLMFDDLVTAFLRRYKETDGESNFECEIGERRDSICDVHVSHDKSQAFLSVTPNYGGKTVTIADVKKQMEANKVTWGIIPLDIIEDALEQGSISNLIIARALAPVDGIDTKFLSFVPEAHERKPLVDENGDVDHRERGDIVVVHKGDVIMERVPPIPGKKGRNVLGEIIEPHGGKDIPFVEENRKGVEVNPENPNQLISIRTGQPIVIPNGIIVIPVYTVAAVNLSTGHIRFDGSVVVKGDVEAGMRIHALEDVIVDGDVADARIESVMGSITIKGGVTGNTQLIASSDISIRGGAQGYDEKMKKEKEKEGKADKSVQSKSNTARVNSDADASFNVAKISSRGSVVVGFAENFQIEAGIDILAEKYVMNCRLMAQNSIVSGQRGRGLKPSIIGGETLALTLVKGTVIGSDMGAKTVIQVGSNPVFHKRVQELSDILLQNKEEQKMLKKVVQFIENSPEKNDPELLERTNYTLSKIVMAAQTYEAELRELTENMTVAYEAKIIAEKGVYAGTQIRINSKLWQAKENRGRSTFQVKRREIVIN